MLKVLVVDDQSFVRKFIKILFSKYFSDAELREAENGLEAWKIYEEGETDLILLDVSMPTMNGLEFLKKLRSIDKTTKVVMMTANANRDLITELLSLGITDYLLKPFDYKKTLERFQKIMSAIVPELQTES